VSNALTQDEVEEAAREADTRIQELKHEVDDLKYKNKLMNDSLRDMLDSYIDIFRSYRYRTDGYIEMLRFQRKELVEELDSHRPAKKRKTITIKKRKPVRK
jgi:hypothetical protein